jgi:selenide,water dikinase
MAERSGCTVVLDAGRLPLYPGAREAAARGVRTGGDARNREYLGGRVVSSAPPELDALCFDPQTSGGLLAAVAAGALAAVEDAGFVAVGEVEAGPPGVRIE